MKIIVLAIIFASIGVLNVTARPDYCHGQVGGGCDAKDGELAVCCGDAGCCFDGCSCDDIGCSCGGTMEANSTDKKYPEYLIQSNFQDDNYDRISSEFVTLAIKKNGLWQIGQTVHSSKVKKGDFIWWPSVGKDDINYPDLKVSQIQHYDVTHSRAKCCVGISISFPPSCTAKVCCGGGCCC